jgi:hypothetical protein
MHFLLSNGYNNEHSISKTLHTGRSIKTVQFRGGPFIVMLSPRFYLRSNAVLASMQREEIIVRRCAWIRHRRLKYLIFPMESEGRLLRIMFLEAIEIEKSKR